MNITGYRTNENHTETLAWEEHQDGTVTCDHVGHDDGLKACDDCVEADSRLAHNELGGVEVAYWPTHAVREGRNVRYVYAGR